MLAAQTAASHDHPRTDVDTQAPVPGRRTQQAPVDASDSEQAPAWEAITDVAAGPKQELPHRARMERTFGVDLSGVTATLGADLSRLGARAAARGNHIAFAETNPTPALVAHEVTHVLQHRRAGGGSCAKGAVAPETSDAEHEAERIESMVARGDKRVGPVCARPAGTVHLKRLPKEAFSKGHRRTSCSSRSLLIAGGRSSRMASRSSAPSAPSRAPRSCPRSST